MNYFYVKGLYFTMDNICLEITYDAYFLPVQEPQFTKMQNTQLCIISTVSCTLLTGVSNKRY